MTTLLTALWLLLLAVYIVIGTMVWRRAAWVFADRERANPEEPFVTYEIVWGLLLGAAFAIIWPLTLAVYAARAHGVPALGRRFLLPPPHIRRELEAREAEARERRIAELERETHAWHPPE